MSPEKSKSYRIGIWITVALLAAYLLSIGDRLGSVDEYAILSLAENIEQDGEVRVSTAGTPRTLQAVYQELQR